MNENRHELLSKILDVVALEICRDFSIKIPQIVDKEFFENNQDFLRMKISEKFNVDRKSQRKELEEFLIENVVKVFRNERWDLNF